MGVLLLLLHLMHHFFLHLFAIQPFLEMGWPVTTEYRFPLLWQHSFQDILELHPLLWLIMQWPRASCTTKAGIAFISKRQAVLWASIDFAEGRDLLLTYLSWSSDVFELFICQATRLNSFIVGSLKQSTKDNVASPQPSPQRVNYPDLPSVLDPDYSKAE